MINGLYNSVSALRICDMQQQVNANNLANVNTVGFKLDRVVVQTADRPLDRVGPGASVDVPGQSLLTTAGLIARGSLSQFTAGAISRTGQALDVALDTGSSADGFLAVSDEGRTLWTRDGRLTMDAQGRLITQGGGFSVLDAGGLPVKLEPEGGPVSIDETGAVMQGSNAVAQLKLATFDRPELLAKQGDSVFAAPADASAKPFRGQVMQACLEGSNVDAMSLLAASIQCQRAYEMNANMIRLQDEVLGRAVNDIARLS